jgi:hypothetical protein
MSTLGVEVGESWKLLRVLSPKPRQNVGSKDGDSGASSDAGQSSFRARLPVGKLIATYNDCD